MCNLSVRRYVTVLLLIAFLAFLNLSFAVKFTGEQNTAWVGSVLIGCLTGECCLTPARALASFKPVAPATPDTEVLYRASCLHSPCISSTQSLTR